LPFTLAFQKVKFLPTNVERVLKEYFYMNVDSLSASPQLEHLKSIYERMMKEQSWSHEVLWTPLERIQIQWPKTFVDGIPNLMPLEVTWNGKKVLALPEDIVKIMNQDHLVNRLEVEVKPWIRRDQKGGICFKLLTMDLSVF